MIWGELSVNSGNFWTALVGLLLFGTLYNGLVAYLERKKYIEGFVSLMVVGGVVITLMGAALISWQASAIVFACFAASGLPMVAGSIWRYMRTRRLMQEADRTEAIEEIWR